MNGIVSTIFKGDRIIWVVLVLLSMISFLAVYSATGRLAYNMAEGQTTYYLIRQAGFIGGGFLLIIILVNFVPVKLYSLLAPFIMLLTIAALAAAIVQFFLSEDRDTTRSLKLWLFSFQPAEMAKIAIILFAAKLLAKNQKTKKDLRTAFFWILGAATVLAVFLYSGNASAMIMVYAGAMLLMFIGRVPVKYLLLACLIGLLALTAMYFAGGGSFKRPEATQTVAAESAVNPADASVATVGDTKALGRSGTFRSRVDNYLFGSKSDNGKIEQQEYALLAIYKGGLTGRGPGGSEVSNYMEAAYNDYIYAIIIEEYGLIGGVVLVFLFLVLLYRGVVIVRQSERTFPAFLAAGMIVMIVMQAFINMAVSAGVIPVTGQPLPWVSMGGTSIIFTAVSFGIILSVSYHNRKNQTGADEQIVVNLPDEDQEL